MCKTDVFWKLRRCQISVICVLIQRLRAKLSNLLIAITVQKPFRKEGLLYCSDKKRQGLFQRFNIPFFADFGIFTVLFDVLQTGIDFIQKRSEEHTSELQSQ